MRPLRFAANVGVTLGLIAQPKMHGPTLSDRVREAAFSRPHAISKAAAR
jgi:hypothetical protein